MKTTITPGNPQPSFAVAATVRSWWRDPQSPGDIFRVVHGPNGTVGLTWMTGTDYDTGRLFNDRYETAIDRLGSASLRERLVPFAGTITLEVP